MQYRQTEPPCLSVFLTPRCFIMIQKNTTKRYNIGIIKIHSSQLVLPVLIPDIRFPTDP